MNNEPLKYKLTTDYATMKGDGYGQVTVTFPASQTIPATTTRAYSATISLGVTGSIIRSRIYSNVSPRKVSCSVANYVRNGTSGGFPTFYSLNAFISRSGPSEIQCTLIVPNFQTTSITTSSTAEVVTFDISTFIPPFV